MMSLFPFETLASIDLGSNSFHMLIAKVNDAGELSKLDSLRESVRLGEGLTEDMMLTEESQERALACLERFGKRIESLPRGAVRIAGTNTLRKAQNAGAFIEKAQNILGYPIEIISGIEEARLIYLGIVHGHEGQGGRRLVIDIGGGSTELILGEGQVLEYAESLSLGCVELSLRCFSDGELSEERFERAINSAKLAILPVLKTFVQERWEHVIGCSGSIKAIRKIVLERGWSASGITLSSLYSLKQELIQAGHVDVLSYESLKKSRRAVLAGGLSALIALFEMFGLQEMEVSRQALREGLLYDLIGRMEKKDVRDGTIVSVMKRWNVDEAQARRVMEMAMFLFSQVRQDWGLVEPGHAALLRWAALLHEIGLQISHRRYHRHGAYVLSHADLAGFSFQDQQLLATLVLNHRRTFKFDELTGVEMPAGLLKALCVVLRLAVLFCRKRFDEPLPPVLFLASEGKIELQCPTEWLAEHPLLEADLEKEHKYLVQAGVELQIVPVPAPGLAE